ncbi:hypothetical protein AKO1_006925 [Acrasis kona]|uniref:Zinc finger LSD1-type domain-containing protein n=1 Tax=Acrasis kona TaxID=1008807 RepID=A0AAW2YV93_9EUKA
MGSGRPFIHFRERTCRHVCACDSVLSYPVGAKIIRCPECKEIRRVSIDNEYVQSPCSMCLSQLLIPRYCNEFRCPSCGSDLTVKVCCIDLSIVEELDKKEEERQEAIRSSKKLPEPAKKEEPVIVVIENPPSHVSSEGKIFEKTNKVFGIESPQKEPELSLETPINYTTTQPV